MLEVFLEHLYEVDLEKWLGSTHWIVIAIGLVVGILVLGKSADVLVECATDLSLHLGIPQIIVGATIVSLGTTMPEAVVSVLAAIGGNPQIALGNAVGSIICDTGLILGTACLIAPIPLDRWLVNRQGFVQFGAGLLLVGLCVPWSDVTSAMTTGGNLPQWAGFLFLGLLSLYVIWSIRIAKSSPSQSEDDETNDSQATGRATVAILGMLLIAIFFVVLSSEVLIASANETAVRLSVPPGVIAATLVAFGTSLPELVIAVTASFRGRGELAIGNVIGADILNVLFVAGAAAAVTPGGLEAAPEFFRLQFPAMLAVLITFRIAIVMAKGNTLPRWAGFLLVGFYVVYVPLTFIWR